ncbi:MAG: ribose-phosphate diphosphokinase, partial [Nitrospinae bacterium]|nr:ribose-phosphate diphosphokinase [Nitrospinota bacterium]
IVVSPDAGGVERARAFAKRLDCGLGIIDKRREAKNVAKAMNIIGDVEGMNALLVDDMIDTAGTLTEGVKALYDKGCKGVYACCSHAVLSGPAFDRIAESNIIEVVVTDSIPLETRTPPPPDKIKILSIAPLLSEAIKRIHTGSSVSSLFF